MQNRLRLATGRGFSLPTNGSVKSTAVSAGVTCRATRPVDRARALSGRFPKYRPTPAESGARLAMPWRRRFALRAFGRSGFKPKLELRCKLGRDPGDGTPAAKLKHYPVERALRLPGELERERGLAAARLAVEQPHCRDPPRARRRASQAPRPGLRNRAVEAERKT